MDDRQQQLRQWVQGRLPAVSGFQEWECVAGDASARRYFRLRRDGESWIAVDAPPSSEKNTEFLQVRELLAARGACVPQLFEVDRGQGFMLLADLGDRQLLEELDDSTVDATYHQALALLRGLYRLPLQVGQLPDYDAALLEEELQRFPRWFCQALLGCELGESGHRVFAECAARLIETALEQPRVFVHRDFHSRNLLVQPDGGLGVIDFQDALYGPVTYDPASLLKDCYINWPRVRVESWLEEHRLALQGDGMPGIPAAAEFLRWFDWMGLQRHLKVLGTFARLYLRDGKSAYLHDLPLVLAYVDEVLERYGEFSEMRDLFRRRLNPVIEIQQWSVKS